MSNPTLPPSKAERPPLEEGLIVIDAEKKIVFVNPIALELLGKTRDEVIGRPCGEFASLFPCAEEVCTLRAGATCPLFRSPGTSVSENDTLLFETKLLRSGDGSPLGAVHIVSLSPPPPSEKDTPSFQSLVGSSPPMQRLFELIQLVSKTDVTVHIFGENGTGKELVADAIHHLSSRSGKRLVKVNCSAIPGTLLESTLFGHAKGAFTGAHKESQGYVEYADGGTLFLDEIGELSHDIQVKLLRLLQSREYSKVGESRVRKADLRILTATNRDLRELVEQGKMREDFYYRINVFPISVPSLKERGEDILILAHHFIELFNHRFSKKMVGLSKEAADLFANYRWPGNVRELEHSIEHAFVLASNGYIEPRHLPSLLKEETETEQASLTQEGDEREAILHALSRTEGNKTKAAMLLGYSRVTLWKKLKRYGLAEVTSSD